jgi:hypothetical protein
MGKVIYHGTPMTPKAALLDVLSGRAGCVSFFRPDDVEAVEAVCPRVMFRQRRIQLLDGSIEARRGMGRQASRLDAVLSLVGAAPAIGALGGHSRYAGRTLPAQRQPAGGMAIRHVLRRSAMAYGWSAGSSRAPVQQVRHGRAGMDRRSEARACGLRPIPAQDGRGVSAVRQSMARHAHDARDQGGVGLRLCQRRRHEPCTERASL